MLEPREPENHGREIFTPKQSFAPEIDGVVVVMTPGRTLIREGHVLLSRFPDMFEPVRVEYDVEEATAVPGRRRAR